MIAVALVLGAVVARLASDRGGGRSDPAGDAAPAPIALEPSPAAGAGSERYVSPGGDDRARGSRARPWRTLRHAAGVVSAGTTVHVGPGRYAGPLRIARSGTASAPIRFVSDERWGARIGVHRAVPFAAVELWGDHVSLEGFDVTASGPDGTQAIDLEGDHDAVIGNRVHDVDVPCRATGNGGAGIVAGGGRTSYRNHDLLVAGNVIHDIGRGPAGCRLVHGIYAAVPRVTIINNVVARALGDGITSWHAARSLVIANNLSADNGGAGILVGSGDTGAGRGNAHTLVSNNIVIDNAQQGITEASDGTHRVGPGNRYLHNLAFANHGGDRSARWGVGGLYPGAVVAGTVDADPGFGPTAATAAGGFVPDPGSPAVDAGTSVGAPATDVRGVARPQGGGVDIGPYEQG